MTTVIDRATSLPKCESLFYFICWISAVFYSIYKVSLFNTCKNQKVLIICTLPTDFNNYHDVYNDFSQGWIWLGRKQDISDQEWKTWIPLMVRLMPWLFLHHSVSHVIKALPNIMLLCYWYIFTSVSFLYFSLGIFGALCALIQPSILYILTYKRRNHIIWLINTLFLILIHFLKIPDGIFQNMLQLSDEEHYLLTLTMCWIQLRSISCTIDNKQICVDDNYHDTSHFLRNFLWALAYSLYLPTLHLGPLILYHEFINSIKKPFQVWKLAELGYFALNFVRYVFWILFANFFLHFLYFNAMHYHPKVVESLNSWALYGLGYCMGQFFLIKYVVVYGLNRTLCTIDRIKAPSQPKCVARVHLYSDMWKYFDEGLYKFLVRYIYTPLLTSNFNKLLASFLCFTFVFVWHGMQTNIFIWALLNFIGLNIENLTKLIEKSKYCNNVQTRYMSPINVRRVHCVLTSPLLAMSVISNFYFFAGEEIGHIYVYRILNDIWYSTLVLLYFLYCCCQVSIDLKNWESKKF